MSRSGCDETGTGGFHTRSPPHRRSMCLVIVVPWLRVDVGARMQDRATWSRTVRAGVRLSVEVNRWPSEKDAGRETVAEGIVCRDAATCRVVEEKTNDPSVERL